MKSLTMLIALLLVVPMPGQKPATKKLPAAQTKAPTQADVEKVLKRIYGYDPSIAWKIFFVRPSTVPGMTEVFFQVKNDYHHLFLTPDGHFAIDGDMQPFSPDPYAVIRTRLKAADGLARGPAQPVVTMVEFSDLQCPHCRESQPVIERLAADFPGMRIVFQQYPLSSHPWAMKGALYADCAGRINNEAAWKFVASIYENQGGIALAAADDKLKELATAAGFDAAKLSTCAAEPATEARVKKSIALGDSLGVMGTPYIYLNGRLLDTVVEIPYEQLKKLVEYEIAHAGK